MFLTYFDNFFIFVIKEILYYLDYLSVMFFISEFFFIFTFILITNNIRLFLTNSVFKSQFVKKDTNKNEFKVLKPTYDLLLSTLTFERIFK